MATSLIYDSTPRHLPSIPFSQLLEPQLSDSAKPNAAWFRRALRHATSFTRLRHHRSSSESSDATFSASEIEADVFFKLDAADAVREGARARGKNLIALLNTNASVSMDVDMTSAVTGEGRVKALRKYGSASMLTTACRPVMRTSMESYCSSACCQDAVNSGIDIGKQRGRGREREQEREGSQKWGLTPREKRLVPRIRNLTGNGGDIARWIGDPFYNLFVSNESR